ncbi:hypothetical protein MMC17_003631 [Xylographa soralifera]|nr:hypothetical protein [Xylographa soralifera]
MSLPPSISLHGKVAIVTGASRGLGKDIALELASRGANICITYTADSSTALAEVVAKDVRKYGVNACIVRADIAGPDCGKEIIDGALRGLEVEKIDILVNNAAIGQEPQLQPMADFRIEEYQRVMDTNVRGPLLLVQALIPHLACEGARIINISSVVTKYPVSGLNIYAPSKAALETLTRQWAVELAKKHHLTVNAINCGVLDKEPNIPPSEAVLQAREGIMSITSAAQRIGTGDDLAQIVAFLASEGSRWINGQVLCGNGGVTFF